MNVQTNKGINVLTYKRTNVQTKERPNDGTMERWNERTNERTVKQRIGEQRKPGRLLSTNFWEAISLWGQILAEALSVEPVIYYKVPQNAASSDCSRRRQRAIDELAGRL